MIRTYVAYVCGRDVVEYKSSYRNGSRANLNDAKAAIARQLGYRYCNCEIKTELKNWW